jgi:hypothetical protein
MKTVKITGKIQRFFKNLENRKNYRKNLKNFLKNHENHINYRKIQRLLEKL